MQKATTILVIDDSPDFRNLLREALKLEGYNVVEASDGREGIRLFRDNRPALVLLDMIMPEKEGIETLREILTIDSEAVVFTFSGLPGADAHNETALVLGARKGFSKPFRMAGLLEAIRSELIDQQARTLSIS